MLTTLPVTSMAADATKAMNLWLHCRATLVCPGTFAPFANYHPNTEPLQPDTGDVSATASLCRTPLILSIVMVMRGACSTPAWCLGGISPAANDQHDHRPPCLNLGNSSSICLGNREAKSGVSWEHACNARPPTIISVTHWPNTPSHWLRRHSSESCSYNASVAHGLGPWFRKELHTLRSHILAPYVFPNTLMYNNLVYVLLRRGRYDRAAIRH